MLANTSDELEPHQLDMLYNSTTTDPASNASSNTSSASCSIRPPKNAEALVSMMWMVSGPIIFVVGMCGNALILLVMTRRQMSGTSTSVHLCIMAVADMFVLAIGLVPEWFEICFQSKFKELHPITCKLEKFLFYTSGDTSIWVLVIFTLDRLVAIAFPLYKKSNCVSSRAKLFGFMAFLVAVTKNLHVFWTRGPEYDKCKMLKSNCGKPTLAFEYFESFTRPWIVFATVNALPFIVILCCNIVIIRALFVVRRMSTVGILVSPSANDRSMVQMTTMCLSASFCFLICITPSIILIIGRPHWTKAPAYDVAKGFSNILVYVNHSINFFLYCLTGKRFRRLLVWCLTSSFRRDAASFRGDSIYAPESRGSYRHRSSAFGFMPRKSSIGLVTFDRRTGSRRTSSDGLVAGMSSPLPRSMSRLTSIAERSSSTETTGVL